MGDVLADVWERVRHEKNDDTAAAIVASELRRAGVDPTDVLDALERQKRRETRARRKRS